MSKPVTNLVTYRPKPGKEKELLALIEKHEPALRKTGLITKEPVRVWSAKDVRGQGKDKPYFVEFMQWRDEEAPGLAHQAPEIMAVWEPMQAVLEELQITVLEST